MTKSKWIKGVTALILSLMLLAGELALDVPTTLAGDEVPVVTQTPSETAEPAPTEKAETAASTPVPESEEPVQTQTPATVTEPVPTPTETLPSAEEAEGGIEVAVTSDGLPCVAGEVIVVFEDHVKAGKAESVLESVDAEATTDVEKDVQLVEIPAGETIESLIDDLESLPEVKYAQPNYVYQLSDTCVAVPTAIGDGTAVPDAVVNDPGWTSGMQWYLDVIGCDDAWNTTWGSSSVRVAVLDTGVDLDHPDLTGQIVAQADTVTNDGNADDDDGHGTHVAGIIAAKANNGSGIAGIAPGAGLIAVDVFQSDGTNWWATTADIVEGISFAVANGADVINMSLGSYGVDSVETNAVNNATAAGVVVVAAAGNDSRSDNHYPSDIDSVISVIATDWDDVIASYSNYGPQKDISAPGGDFDVPADYPESMIMSTYVDHGVSTYAWMAGTSMASPVVAGVAALVLSANPSLSVDGVKNILYTTARDVGAPGRDSYYGWGRVDAAAAVAAAVSNGQCTITAVPNDPNAGVVSGGGVSAVGAGVTLRAMPNTGYLFVRWAEAGATVSTNAEYTFTAGGDRSLVAEFAAIGLPLVSAQYTGSNSINLSWSSVQGAAGYELFRSTSQWDNFSYVTALTGTSYTDSGLSFNTRYYYTVRAYSTVGATTYGSMSVAVAADTAPVGTPSLTVQSAGTNSVNLSWPAVEGAAGYELFRSNSEGGNYAYIAGLRGTSYTDNGVAFNTRYYYKVRAYSTIGAMTYGDLSAAATVVPVTGVSAVWATPVSYNKITVTWTRAAGASSYQLYRATSPNGAYKLLSTTSRTSYANSSLSTGTTYYYKVRAYRKVGSKKIYGDFSALTSAAPSLGGVVRASAVRRSSSSIKISWSSVSGKSRYEVWRSTSPVDGFALVKTTSSRSLTDKKLKSGVTYYYMIRAYRSVGRLKVYGGYSYIVSARP